MLALGRTASSAKMEKASSPMELAAFALTSLKTAFALLALSRGKLSIIAAFVFARLIIPPLAGYAFRIRRGISGSCQMQFCARRLEGRCFKIRFRKRRRIC